ncbi:phosphotransferase [Nocardia sp. NPDC127526]|uniref:phosphotransferase n=1 Tax=Nocardia sp. NPDC127526 TaxID=3345393 RepID=UPI003637A959
MPGQPPDESIALLAELARQAGAAGDPEVLSGRPDGLVVRVGHLVVKSHPADTDPAALATRLHLAAEPLLHEILVPPIPSDGNLLVRRAGRLLSLWPFAQPVDPADPEAIPWAQAAELLARLHRTPLPDCDHPGHPGGDHPDHPGGDRPDHPGADHPGHPGAPLAGISPRRVDSGHKHAGMTGGTGDRAGVPATSGPARVYRALQRLRAAGDAADPATASVVRHAFATLPDLSPFAGPGDQATLVHGDFHLGQLVRWPGGEEEPWRLIDVDDLGVGDPVWDLARFAGYFAAAILDPIAWERFLNAYRWAGGPAVPEGDPWAVLDVPARALVIQAAALAVAKAGLEGRELDEWDVALLDSCRRMRSAVS